MKLSDLKPAPYNPRTISAEALSALQTSLGEFGDLSGVTWNKATGHLVAGHQRLEALKKKHGNKLAIKDGAIVTPAGETFPVRVVDWPEAKEKAANLAANSPFLAGSFDSGGLAAVLADLNVADGLGSLVGDLRLAELLPSAGDLFAVLGGDGTPVVGGNDNGDAVPAGDSEWITFSTPLTAAQHQIVIRAIRVAKERDSAKVPDALCAMAESFLKEDEQHG